MGPRPSLRPVVGVEQEFSLFDRTKPVGFRSLIDQIGLGQPSLDPDDPNAHRLATGSVVTCDGNEAEIASAPIEIAPGFGAAAQDWAARETASLADRLPDPIRMKGFSTHISVEVPESLTALVAAAYVSRFGPGMLVAMDGPEAPGLRVRPRHRRLELCGDYVEGERLSDAAEYAAGSVAACVAAIINGTTDDLPEPIPAVLRPAVERPGWFIDRRSLGVESGALDDHVAAAAAVARVALERWLVEIDRLHGGPEMVERDPTTPFARVLGERERPGFALAPVMVTWPLVVFIGAEETSGAPAFVTVPRDWLGAFLDRLDEGELDAAILDYLTERPRRQTYAESWADVSTPGLFDAIPSRLALLPSEPM
jgi:hypothetical protein